MRIPFKSLSFQSEDTQSWGINVIRRVQHSGHEQTWTPALLGRASFLAQSGTLRDLSGFDRGLVLDISPVVTSAIDGTSQSSGWGYDAQRPQFGANVRWGVTSNLTLNGTLNPDFSQVEADEGRTQYDPRRAVFFPEKRPFFLEGSEYFQAPNRLLYTRRIADPVAATKFTGKVGGTELAFLSAAGRQGPFQLGPLSRLQPAPRQAGCGRGICRRHRLHGPAWTARTTTGWQAPTRAWSSAASTTFRCRAR